MASKARHEPAVAEHLYRYRTSALVGPWRKSERQAMRDALHARQACRDDRDRTLLRWLVPGQIEETEES
jgi:hypothetical protein